MSNEPGPESDRAAAPQPGRPWSVGRIAAVVTVLAMVVFWAWIFAGGPKKANPDYLSDRAYASRAEARCQQLLDTLAKLPAARDTPTPEQRVPVLEEATAEVADMVADLEADAPRTGDDAASLKGWFADWHTYLDDRRDFAARLAKDPKAEMFVSRSNITNIKDTVDQTIQVFTEVNDIRACATPGDVG